MSFNFFRHITEPTRITSHSRTLIDHQYITGTNLITFSGVCELNMSDHRAVYCFMNSLSRCSTRVKHPLHVVEYRNFNKLDVSRLENDLSTAPWSVVSALDDVNDKVECFLKLFTDVWNTHAPIIKRRVRKRVTPWMTPNVLHLIQSRDRAYRNQLKCNSEKKRLEYKSLRNRAAGAIRNAKRAFFIYGAHKGKKQLWRNIKLCTGYGKAKSFRSPWPCTNNFAATNSANMVNKHFIDSVLQIINGIFPQQQRSICLWI